MNCSKYLEPYKDMFNIYNLITFINKNYILCYHKKLKCFCIINSAKNNQICLKFNNFHQNILKLLEQTKIENSKKLFKFIDEHNQILEENNNKFAKEKLSSAIHNLYDYSKKTNQISNNDINKIIEGTYD